MNPIALRRYKKLYSRKWRSKNRSRARANERACYHRHAAERQAKGREKYWKDVDKSRRYHRQWYWKHRKQIIAAAVIRNKRPEVRAAIRRKQLKYRRKIKAEMIAAYGGCCSCCGVSISAFLTLEHKKRDGQKHRAAVSDVYRDLKKRGWPKEDYCLLCMNCNWGSRLTGLCPHKQEVA